MVDTSDTPAGRIARLNASLLAHGGAAILRRRIGTTENYVNLTVRYRKRMLQSTADQLVGMVKQTEDKFVMSPTEILTGTATWPGGSGAWPGPAGGRIWPGKRDLLVVLGEEKNIEGCRPVEIGGAVVRLDGEWKGA